MAAGDSIQGFNRKALKEIQEAIDRLPKEFTQRRAQTVLKQGLKPFISSAKSKAPSDTGNLKGAIGIKTFRNNKRYIFAGVKTKKGGGKGDGFYAKFLEYGFTHVAWPEKGKRIDKGDYSADRLKKIEPKPFLRPAWDETKNRVKDETIRISEKRIKAYLKKVKKK
jgi:HK97 gp10 family phage protein